MVDGSIFCLVEIRRAANLGGNQLLQAVAGEEIPGGLLKIQELGDTAKGGAHRLVYLLHKGHIIGVVEGVGQIPQPGHVRFGQLVVPGFVPLLDEVLGRCFDVLGNSLRPVGTLIDRQRRRRLFFFGQLAVPGNSLRPAGTLIDR